MRKIFILASPFSCSSKQGEAKMEVVVRLAPHLRCLTSALRGRAVTYRGWQITVVRDGDLQVTSPRLTKPWFWKSTGCSAHLREGCGGHKCPDCPFIRAVQGFLTKLGQALKKGESDAECFCSEQEQSASDSDSSAPGSQSCDLDKQAEHERRTDARLPEESDASEKSEDSTSREVAEAEAGEAPAEAPQTEAASPDELVVEEMLAEAEEVDSGLIPSDSSQPGSEGATEADGGSPASGAPSSGEEGDNFSRGGEENARAGGENSSPDSCAPGARTKAGSEGPCQERAGQGSSNPTEEGGADFPCGGNSSAFSSAGNQWMKVIDSPTSDLWEMALNPVEGSAYGGGGAQAHGLTAKDSTASVEKQVTLLLQRFFSSLEDLFRKREGWDRWDAKKVICSTLAPHTLPSAKFSRPSARKISFWVDVSGSVAYLADFIVNLIVAACKDQDVQVVIGSEAHPQTVLPKSFFRENRRWTEYLGDSYIRNFEDQVANFLKRERLEQGTTIVIWSDYMDINADNLEKLARLFRPYKVVWLCSHNGKDPAYGGNESFKLERFAKKEGHLFLWGIDGLDGVRKALREINVKKRR